MKRSAFATRRGPTRLWSLRENTPSACRQGGPENPRSAHATAPATIMLFMRLRHMICQNVLLFPLGSDQSSTFVIMLILPAFGWNDGALHSPEAPPNEHPPLGHNTTFTMSMGYSWESMTIETSSS